MLADHTLAAPDREPLRELLDALAAEARELAASADRLQDLFGRLMDPQTPTPTDAVEQAQALDSLVQRLDGLQAFLAGLAAARLDDLGAEVTQVADRLRLTSQARRFDLSRQAAREALKGGDYDLF